MPTQQVGSGQLREGLNLPRPPQGARQHLQGTQQETASTMEPLVLGRTANQQGNNMISGCVGTQRGSWGENEGALACNSEDEKGVTG